MPDQNSRISRLCDACGLTDDHPHHLVAHPTAATDMHIDCCAATGCETCAQTLEQHDNKKGADLLASIMASTPMEGN